MAYITADDVYNYRLYNLTSSDVTSATVMVFIAEAEGIINGAIADLYTVPFSSGAIPDLIKTIDRDFTAYYVCDFLYQQQNRNYDGYINERYKRAHELLSSIKSQELLLVGSLTTGGIGTIPLNVSTNLVASSSNMPLIVNMDDAFSWKVPGTLLDNIEAGRQAAQ